MAASDPQALAHKVGQDKAAMEDIVERAVGLAEQGFAAAQKATARAALVEEAVAGASLPGDKLKSWNERLDKVASGLEKLLLAVVLAGAVSLAAALNHGTVVAGFPQAPVALT